MDLLEEKNRNVLEKENKRNLEKKTIEVIEAPQISLQLPEEKKKDLAEKYVSSLFFFFLL